MVGKWGKVGVMGGVGERGVARAEGIGGEEAEKGR